MEKEKIELSEHIFKSFIDEDYEDYDENEDLGFNFVEQNTTYTDIPKGYTTEEVIIQRKSDNKYFRFHYTDSEYASVEDTNNFPLKLTEVFPKKIQMVIYE